MFRRAEKPLYIAKYEFNCQFDYPLVGANACTSISFSMCTRFLRMNRNEFFASFPPTIQRSRAVNKNALAILNGCLQAGVDLNKEISKNCLQMLQKKSIDEVAKGIKNLSENFGGAQDLVLLSSNVVSLHPSIHQLITLEKFHAESLLAYREQLSENEVAFAAIAGGHTISFFSRTNTEGQRFYYLIDSAYSKEYSDVGRMEIFDSCQNLMSRLHQKWKRCGIAEIQAFTVCDRVRMADKMEEKAPRLE